jgi:Leucine-rich repeat (LRR) protein
MTEFSFQIPLREFLGLRLINLANNHISSFGFLNGCKNVIEVNLAKNSIRNLEVEISLPKLKILVLDGNPLESTNGIGQLENLELLSL